MGHGDCGICLRSASRPLLPVSVDFYHAVQQLWKGAAAGRDGRTTQARRWFGWARHRLRHGQPDGVLADLAEAFALEHLPDTARDTLRTVYAYLERHREHIDYETYKALGLPLGEWDGRKRLQMAYPTTVQGGWYALE